MVPITGDETPRGSVEALLEGFERYLTAHMNVRLSTRACYARHADAFLTGLAGPDARVELSRLDAVTVRDHVSVLIAPYAPQTKKLMATSFRGLLRFAWLEGHTSTDLTGTVGPVSAPRGIGPRPRPLSGEEMRLLLDAQDLTTLTGIRDYAVLVVLSRLGLRASEVAGLLLDDLDWEAGTLTARIKGEAVHRLPLPHDVGAAIVGYLSRRPDSYHREIFLKLQGRDEPMTGWAVSALVARATARAGLGTVHAHRLRHTTARAVLEAGGGMGEVGELLGHRSEEVTRMYASLDLVALRGLARPWPVSAGACHD